MSKIAISKILPFIAAGIRSKFTKNTRFSTRTGRNFGVAMRSSGLTRTQRRNLRRRRKRNGIEINKAEGGFKPITIPYRTQGIGINTYARLVVTKVGNDWKYGFQPETENYATYEEYNIINMLNNSDEFKGRLRTTSQYRILGVRICIMNNRIPEAKDRLSKLLVYVNTTKVSVLSPKTQNNVMELNMNTIGTKNFNFNINNSNIGKDFTGWFDGEDLYTGNVYLHVAGQDINYLAENNESSVILGTCKVTFSVLTRIQDHLRNAVPTRKESNEEKIKRLEAELNELKLKTVEQNKEPDDDEDSSYEGDEEFINSLSEK